MRGAREKTGGEVEYKKWSGTLQCLQFGVRMKRESQAVVHSKLE